MPRWDGGGGGRYVLSRRKRGLGRKGRVGWRAGLRVDIFCTVWLLFTAIFLCSTIRSFTCH